MTAKSPRIALNYFHVDVFAPRPYGGNSLPVFVGCSDLEAVQMLAITQELRQFETIFLEPASAPMRYRARVFDLFEELPFAGHPLIGAAAVLHHLADEAPEKSWTLDLTKRSVSVTTARSPSGYFGLLDQGPAEFLGEISARAEIAAAFNLSLADLDPRFPLAVVSTGLSYLIVPIIADALPHAGIRTDITPLLRRFGAQFAVLLDEKRLEVRHWNNDGIIEDIATGSAAGTIGAYRMRYCGAEPGRAFTLHQGRFVGRASQIMVRPFGSPDRVEAVKVGGDVAIVGRGTITALP